MTNTPDNPQAFPQIGGDYFDESGMTLRDYFAGQALAKIIDMLDRQGNDPAFDFDGYAAKGAYEIADAMLAERSKK